MSPGYTCLWHGAASQQRRHLKVVLAVCGSTPEPFASGREQGRSLGKKQMAPSQWEAGREFSKGADSSQECRQFRGTGKGFAAKTVNHTHLHLRQEVPSTPRKSDSYGGAATRQLWGSEEEPTDRQPGAGLRESWGHEDPGCSLLLPSSLLLDPPAG